jgi:hypothetical protein
MSASAGYSGTPLPATTVSRLGSGTATPLVT